MRVITNFSRIYFDDPIQNFELNKFSIKKSNLNVYIGDGCKSLLVNKKKFNIYLDFEEPNSYWSVDSRFIFFLRRNYKIFDKIFNLYQINYPRNFESKFDNILTICPYTKYSTEKKGIYFYSI